MTLEIREEIESAVAYARSQLSAETRLAISRANADLYHGPLYLDPDTGEACSCFDDNCARFNFSAACDQIRIALDEIDNVQIEVSYDEETNESEYESVDGSREEIVRQIVGKELFAYVR